MLKRIFGQGRWDEAARSLYGAIVAQSRRREFYLAFAVPDTLDGRFDLLALHVFLVLRRLRDDRGRTARLAQKLFDLMFADMDGNLRELGVGDLSVGRKVKVMVKALYGRIAAYESGLSQGQQLADALGRNLYRGAAVDDRALACMTSYVRAAAADLEEQALDALLAGQVRFAEAIAP
jgi:cytochrome b pre-mRNA-processing protein 3